MFKKLFQNRNEALVEALSKYDEVARKNNELENDIKLLLETNADLREDIRNLERNLEFVVNNLTPAKRKKLGL